MTDAILWWIWAGATATLLIKGIRGWSRGGRKNGGYVSDEYLREMQRESLDGEDGGGRIYGRTLKRGRSRDRKVFMEEVPRDPGP